MKIGLRSLSLMVAGLGVTGSLAQASITPVPTRDGLNATETLDWASAGPRGAFLPSGTVLETTVGTPVEILTANTFRRIDQGRTGGWYGNFEDGSALIYSNGSRTIEINPDDLFQGAGLQVQADFYGPFTAELTAYGLGGSQLGTVTGSGVSSSATGNGRSVFLGFLSDAQDVDKIILRITSAVRFPERFALDAISFVREPEFGGILPIAVPESRHAALVGGVTLLMIGAWRRARSRSE